jgi:oligoendopeptidase F
MVKWNLHDILDPVEIDAECEALRVLGKEFASMRPKLSNSISNEDFLLFATKAKEIRRVSGRINAYIALKHSENTKDPQVTSLRQKIQTVMTEVLNETVFFGLWFKSLPEEIAAKLIKVSGDDSYSFETRRRFKDNTLTEAEEKIANIKDQTGRSALNHIYDVITSGIKFDVTLNGKTTILDNNELTKLITSSNPQNREAAYTSRMNKYESHRAELGYIYQTLLKDWHEDKMKLRSYESPINVRDKANDIPKKAIDALLSACKKNNSLFQEYFKLKSNILKLENPSRFHLYAPYENTPAEYDFEQAKKIVLEMFYGFSKDMGQLAQSMFDHNHIHSEVQDNKRRGAFCYSVTPKIKPFVMLNYAGRVQDVSTLAHELGHAIHAMVASHHSIWTFHSALPLAETASIFSELLLAKHQLKTASAEEKRSILMQHLDHSYAAINRQAYFVMFEKEAHKLQAEGATLDDLDRVYLKGLKEQFEPALDVPSMFKNEWLTIPHIYHVPFYCYAYAFGNLLVLSLFKMYEEQGESFIPKYLELLACGGSKSPQEALKPLGINIESEEFWLQGFEVLREMLEELKSL